ncbi:MAG: ComEC/Rec2 family competence protein [Polaribacter sp.]
MKRIFKYLPLHFIVLFVFGILLQFYFKIWSFSCYALFFLFVFLLPFLKLIQNRILITFLAGILLVLSGVSTVFINDARNYKSYYSNFLQENSKVVFKIEKVLKPTVYYQKYEAKVVQIDKNNTIGKILLNIQKNTLENRLQIDDNILAETTFKELKPPLNPNQFNYKMYLDKKGIYQQVFLKKNQFLKVKHSKTSLIGLSEKFRNYIQKSLQKYHFKKDELAVINALLLGQRQDISKELVSEYSKAGAIHILAVSGLHVGVILLILSFLFKPLERVKKGKFLKAIILVLFLWIFAFIAGLSASVVRAVTMFTFLAVGQAFQRKNNIEFSLFTSMFFLLMIKPMFLFDVGFQLSYLAVFGIISIQPKLVAIWHPKPKIINFFWQLFTVSVAAQVGILPLSIYYFQQFPGLFLVSNFVIIPCLIYILIGGILVITFALLHLLPQFVAATYGTVISWMNSFVGWVAHQETFLFREISISFLLMLAWYIFLFFGVQFLLHKKPKKLVYFLLSVLLVQSIFLYEKNQQQEQKEFIVFNKSRFSVIGERIGDKLYLQPNIDTVTPQENYALKSYRISADISTIEKIDFKNLVQFKENTILLVDSLGIYKINGLEKPIVVLQYSPKINLERLIRTLHPSTIIADASNYTSDVNRWQEVCKKQKNPFCYTAQNGAFIIRK